MQALFLSLFRNLGDVLKERLPPVSADGKMPNLKAGHADSMAVDTEEPPAMDVDQENGKNNGQVNRILGYLSVNICIITSMFDTFAANRMVIGWVIPTTLGSKSSGV